MTIDASGPYTRLLVVYHKQKVVSFVKHNPNSDSSVVIRLKVIKARLHKAISKTFEYKTKPFQN